MDISIKELQKVFDNLNERLECHINISTQTNKKKKAVLCLTLSLGKQVAINIYIVQRVDKNEVKKKLISTAKNLNGVDCHDNPDQPCYDIEFKCLDGKTKRIFANLIEDKRRFIERIMRVMYIHDIDLFKTIQFSNLPISINLEDIYNKRSLDTNYYESEKAENVSDAFDQVDYVPYQNLSDAEEENMQKFLNESADAVINAIEFQETLKQHLLAMEGTNVHSIMSSETQMLKLMDCLDQAIEQVELLESKIDMQDVFLREVEESMSCLRDRDELIRLTAHNRNELQSALEALLYRITLDERHLQALQNFDLTKKDSLVLARQATDKLHAILEAPMVEGLQNMQAVQNKTEELHKAADDFARRFATQFNNGLTRQVNRLMTVSTSNLDKVLDLHRSNRRELIGCADFMAWLKMNRPKTFGELQKLYIDKMATVYDHEICSIIDLIKGKLVSKDKNAIMTSSSSSTSAGSISAKSSSVASLRISEKQRSKHSVDSGGTGTMASSVYSDSSRLSGTSGMFDIKSTGCRIFEEFLSKLKLLVTEEEEFMTRIFRLDCRRLSERNEPVNYKLQPHESHTYLVTASDAMFKNLSAHLVALIQVLEQHDSSQSLLMVVIVDRQFDESVRSSEFMQNTWALLFLHSKRSFNTYIDAFIKSFQAFKTPRRSRCGILPFVIMYSSFAEQTVLVFQDSTRQNDLVIAHQKIIRELINQIDRVASESTKTPKEVIIMENNHCTMDILRRLHWPELDELLQELRSKYQEALNNYVLACVGRPFDKLYSFFENVGEAIDSGIKTADIGYQFAFSKAELKKVVREYPGREVKKGLEHLCKKVEKYVSEDSSLFQVIWVSIQKQFITECLRYESLIDKCYPNSRISLEFSTAELEQFFREIASSH